MTSPTNPPAPTSAEVAASVQERGGLYREHFEAIHRAHGGDKKRMRTFLLGIFAGPLGAKMLSSVGWHRQRRTGPEEAVDSLLRMIGHEAERQGWK